MNICISERSSAPSARLPKWGATRQALISCAVALLMAVLPVVLQGQASGPTRESWTVGLAAGVFNYEPSRDQGFPIIAVRADRPTSKSRPSNTSCIVACSRARAKTPSTSAKSMARWRLADNRRRPGTNLLYILRRVTTLNPAAPISSMGAPRGGPSYTRPEVQTDSLKLFDPSLPAEHTNLFTVTVGLQLRLTVGRLEPYGGISAGFFGRYDGDSAGRRFWRSTFQFPFGIRIWVTDHIGVRGEYRFDEDRHEAGSTHSDSKMTAGVFWTL